MTAIEAFHTASDGIRLRVHEWRPEGRPMASVLVLHGVGEHGARYRGLATGLAGRGIRTVAFDHRGHGESQGTPAHVDRWERYVADGEEMARAFLADEEPGFVYGHSMGSLICLSMAMARRPPDVPGWIVSGVGIEPVGLAKPHLVLVARLLSRVFPRFSIDLGIGAETLSHDVDVVEAYRTDPLVIRKATVRWGTEALGAIDSIKSGAAAIEDPVLILHGGADPLSLASGSAWLHETVVGPSTLHIYDDCLHEPHNDPEYATVVEDVGDWIERHAAA